MSATEKSSCLHIYNINVRARETPARWCEVLPRAIYPKPSIKECYNYRVKDEMSR